MKIRRLIQRRKKEADNNNLENLHDSLSGISGLIENHFKRKNERNDGWFSRLRKKLLIFKERK